jgi:hypothetical protein
MIVEVFTHRLQSYRHDQRPFGMMVLRRKPHIDSVRSMQVQHCLAQLGCQLSCVTIGQERRKNKNIQFPLDGALKSKPNKNLHPRELHFARISVQVDGLEERSGKTRSHLYTI